MGFLSESGNALRDLLSLKTAPELFRSGLSSMEQPIRNLGKGIPGSIGEGLGRLSDFGLNSVLGLPFAYEAVKPNKPELDKAGPFEDLGRRGFNLYMAGAAMSPKLFNRGIAPALTGMIGASVIGDTGSKYLGRGADALTGMRPPPEELMQKFMERVQPRAQEIAEQYKVPLEVGQQHATKELLAEDPEYLDWMER